MVVGLIVSGVTIAAFALAVILHYRREHREERDLEKMHQIMADLYKQRIEDQVDYD